MINLSKSENKCILDTLTTTIICDIDGCIFQHDGFDIDDANTPLLPGVSEQFNLWKSQNAYIVLVTARPESLRQITRNQLCKYSIPYYVLVMNAGSGRRILINDLKPYSTEDTAIAINLERDKGFI